MKRIDNDKMIGGLMKPPHESLMVALGRTPSELPKGPRSLLGMFVVMHIEQVMGDMWLAWHVRRALAKKYPKIDWGDNLNGENPYRNSSWSPAADAIFQVVSLPE